MPSLKATEVAVVLFRPAQAASSSWPLVDDARVERQSVEYLAAAAMS